MPPRRRLLCRAVGPLLVLAACSGSGGVALDLPTSDPTATPSATSGPPVPGDPTPESTTTPGRATLPPDTQIEPGDRLAVQTADLQIVTVRPDGTNLLPLTDAAEGTRNTQATWSRDGNRLAWTTAAPAPAEAHVRAARVDGTAWVDAVVPYEAVALAWDTTGSQVATLAAGDTGLELGIVDLSGVPDYRYLDSGVPLFFSWSPDGTTVLVHASGIRLDLVPADGSAPRVLEPEPGSFQAPVWLPGPAPLVYADRRSGQDFLVVAGDEGAGRREIVTYDGYLQYVASPASGYIALQVLDESRAPLPRAITVGLDQPRRDDPVDVIEQDQLVLMAVFGGDPTLLYPLDPAEAAYSVRAFWFSPDGQSLAWLVQTEPATGDCASETQTLQWHFWHQATLTVGPEFRPTATFACDYLPFFDQYAQSSTYWSPGGNAVVYAGTDINTGIRGIFTTSPDGLEPPTFVTAGEHAVWSPASAGAAQDDR